MIQEIYHRLIVNLIKKLIQHVCMPVIPLPFIAGTLAMGKAMLDCMFIKFLYVWEAYLKLRY
jgi:hypothetical protein